MRLELDPGEAEAIACAMEANARLLLIDERRGRTVAQRLGLATTGLLGVLLLAETGLSFMQLLLQQFQLGRLWADPLIRHLRGLKIKAGRQKDLAEIPLLRISNAVGNAEKLELIVNNLRGRGQSRPRKETTLANTIDSLFTKSLGEAESLGLVKELEKRKFITIKAGNVTYQLPEI